MSDVAQFFPRAQPRLRLIKKERLPAQAADARLESESRAQRWLLEEERDLFPRQCATKIYRACFDGSRKLQHRVDTLGADIADRDKVFPNRRCLDGQRYDRNWLNNLWFQLKTPWSG